MPGICTAFLLGFIITYWMLLAKGEAGPKRTDFVPYYAAATLVAHGHGNQLYDWAAIGARERPIVRPLVVRDGAMPFLYPPYVAVALSPLARLPYDAAYYVWLASNVGLLILAVAALRRHFALRGREALLLWLASVSSLPVLLSLAQGQVSILLLALFVGITLAELAEHEILAGLLLALALVKPPYVLAFLVVLCARRRWKTLGAFLVAGIGLAFVSVMGAGAASIGHFAETLRLASSWSTSVGGFQPKFNQSFAGFSQLIVSGAPATALTAVLDALAVLALARVSVCRRDILSPIGCAVLVGLLISPHTLLHDLSLLVLAAAIILASQDRPRMAGGLVAALYVSTVVTIPISGLGLQVSVLAMSAALACLVIPLPRGERLREGLLERALFLPWRIRNADS